MISTSVRLLAAAFAVSGTAAPLCAQMQAYAQVDGDLLPIVSCTKERLYVMQKGNRRQAHDLNYQIKPANSFAEGGVEITGVAVDLDPLCDAPANERVKPDAIRFRYRATITADRDMSECYALLTYISEGSIGSHLIPIGKLGKGADKKIDVELRSSVTAAGSLHVFSSGVELRSNQHPAPYDVRGYYASLVKNVPGIPAADLLKLEDVHPHELSADGRYLASIREHDGKKFMIVYDLQTMNLVCDSAVASASKYVGDLTWISNHEVAYVGDGSFDDKWSEFGLYLLETQSGKTRKLRDDVQNVIVQLPDQPDVLVLHQFNWRMGSVFYKYNVHTGKDFDLEDPAAGAYLFDRKGVARVQVRYEGAARIYAFRPTPDSGWRNADDVVKQPGLRFNMRGDELLDRVADVHSVGPDGDTLYISTRLGSDRFALAAFSMSTGTIKQTIAQHPLYDLNTTDGETARLLFAKRSPQLLGMIYEGQKPHVVWLDPQFAAVQKSVDNAFPDHVNLPIDWSDDGSTLIYFSSSDRDPGTYYAVRPREGGLIPLLQLAEQLTGRTLSPMTPTDFHARDGTKIPAYVTIPAARAPGPAPLLVMIHGGPMARDDWGFSAADQFFASRGYIVLRVNYRGSSGYGAAFQKAGLYVRLDTVIIDDIADAVRALIAQGDVDPTRIAVMGASFGGWATYMSLIRYPELYRAGIAIAAVSNWRKSVSHDRWIFNKQLGYAFWTSLLRRKDFDAEEPFIEPERRAAEIKQPVFIIHGEHDEVVSVTEAESMLATLKHTNPCVQSRIFPYATHTFWPFADRVVTLNETALFLERYVGESSNHTVTITP